MPGHRESRPRRPGQAAARRPPADDAANHDLRANYAKAAPGHRQVPVVGAPDEGVGTGVVFHEGELRRVSARSVSDGAHASPTLRALTWRLSGLFKDVVFQLRAGLDL